MASRLRVYLAEEAFFSECPNGSTRHVDTKPTSVIELVLSTLIPEAVRDRILERVKDIDEIFARVADADEFPPVKKWWQKWSTWSLVLSGVTGLAAAGTVIARIHPVYPITLGVIATVLFSSSDTMTRLNLVQGVVTTSTRIYATAEPCFQCIIALIRACGYDIPQPPAVTGPTNV